MNRESLLAWRDHSKPCEHESEKDDEGRDIGAYNFNGLFWLCGWDEFTGSADDPDETYRACPGGVAIVTLCVTCKGSGKSGKGKVELTEKGAGVAWSSCDDCVDGLVATSGRIIQWCDEHDQKRMVGQFGDVCLLWIAIEDDGDKGDLRCPFGYRWLSDRIEEQ